MRQQQENEEEAMALQAFIYGQSAARSGLECPKKESQFFKSGYNFEREISQCIQTNKNSYKSR